MARTDASAWLALLGTEEAIATLRRGGAAEAAAALSVVRGFDPEPGPEPKAETVVWRGQPRRVYRIVDLLAAERPSMVRHAIESLRKEMGPLIQRWWAH